jgi:hypothetical protein
MGSRKTMARPTTIGITDATNSQFITKDLDHLANTTLIT